MSLSERSFSRASFHLCLFLMPFIARIKVGHAFNVLLIAALVGGAGHLTHCQRHMEDNYNIYNEEDIDSAAYKKGRKVSC